MRLVLSAPAPAGTPTDGSGVTAQLGSITRSDGTKQLTVGGWPVYTYAGDSSSGMANGQGKNLSGGLWWVLSASGVKDTAMSAGSASAGASSATSSSSGYGRGD